MNSDYGQGGGGKAAALIDAASCGRLAEVQKLLSLGVNVDSENVVARLCS